MLVTMLMMQSMNTIYNATWTQKNNEGQIRNDNDDNDDDSGHVDRGRRPVLHLRDGSGDPVNPRSWVHSQVRIFHLIQLPPTEAKLTNFTLAPVFTFIPCSFHFHRSTYSIAGISSQTTFCWMLEAMSNCQILGFVLA